MLKLLDQGYNLSETAVALDCYPREVRRVGWRYLDKGLEAALEDEERAKKQKLLNKKQESQLIAMVCSDPPEGYARWSVRLITEQAVKRKIVKQISRETVRRTLRDHELKPWREKNVVRS
jgi:putative transposase